MSTNTKELKNIATALGGTDLPGTDTALLRLIASLITSLGSGIASDSEKLGGKLPSEYVLVDDSYKQTFKSIGNHTTDTDLNDIRQTGWYRSAHGNNLFTNNPSGASRAFTLFVESIGSNNSTTSYLRQTLNDYNSTKSWVRVDNGGNSQSWSDWELITSSDPVIVESAVVANEPTATEALTAFKLIPNHDFEKFTDFRIKTPTKDKYFKVEYIGKTGDTETSPGSFRVFNSTLAN